MGIAIALFACASEDGTLPHENVGQQASALWTNGGFESSTTGQAPAAPWTNTTNLNSNGITVQNPQTLAGLNLQPGGVLRTTVVNSATGPGTQTDPNLGATASLRWPRYGNKAAVVNGQGVGNNQNVNSLSQSMTVAAGDVDPTDGLVHVRFTIAPVLQNPAHTAAQQPYYFVQVTNVTKGNAILYSDFNLSGAGIPWKKINGGTTSEIDYTDWQLVDIAPGNAQLAVGDTVSLLIIASGCQPGAHWGEVYLDGLGSTIPGLNVEGTGPAQANAGANITYTFTYRNGSAPQACTSSANCTPVTEACVGGFCAETNVVIDFTTPPNTTFQSIVAPAGATCTTLPVGGTGTITCTFTNPISPSATGTFSVTVNINGGTTTPIVEAAYDIHSTQETTLNGPKIITNVGCTKDTDCSTGNWCNETAKACTPTLPNGTAIPTDAPHTNPTLNGTCTAQAGALVCTSGVCDTADNKCGYANSDGPCTVANGGTVCRSGVCDGADNKCGYANGDGPCTSGNGGTVCRSGACSANGTCEPPGGCNVDADCAAGNFCLESTHTCTPKLPNGTAIPNDPPHTAPTLNGTCTAAAGALVCVSGVCDTNDNKCGYANSDGPCTVANGGTVCRSGVCDPDGNCGYANGDGPCTQANGGTVCRSGACSSNGTCEPPGGCNVDADCTGGNWCNESAHTCTSKLANGTPMPTDPPHTNPSLNGTCSPQAATLVCASGVCDAADSKCGYANGDGPCTAANGGTVCRSGVCDPDGNCGYANGDGPCTAGNGGTVCRSGVCGSNGTCLPPGGCNVDADCTGGKWCNESAHTCTAQLPNGTPVPSDPPHTNPSLNGMCSAQAGALVCVSGVCDTADNECGYANGDGPCTSGNGATVCRSGICATSGANNGLCVACNVTGDCPNGQICDATNHCVTPTPDAGVDAGLDAAPDSAVADSAAPDSSPDSAVADSSVADSSAADSSTADASQESDAAEAPDAADTGTLEGGGCACKSAGGQRANALGGLIAAIALAGAMRLRRRSRRERAARVTSRSRSGSRSS